MKTKKMRKKLNLNKKTVANLNDDDMIKLMGGSPEPTYDSDSCCTWSDDQSGCIGCSGSINE